jgi:hypothetical protein
MKTTRSFQNSRSAPEIAKNYFDAKAKSGLVSSLAGRGIRVRNLGNGQLLVQGILLSDPETRHRESNPVPIQPLVACLNIYEKSPEPSTCSLLNKRQHFVQPTAFCRDPVAIRSVS